MQRKSQAWLRDYIYTRPRAGAQSCGFKYANLSQRSMPAFYGTPWKQIILAPCNRIHRGIGFQIPSHWIPDSNLLSTSGFQIPTIWIPNSSIRVLLDLYSCLWLFKLLLSSFYVPLFPKFRHIQVIVKEKKRHTSVL